MSMPIDFIGPRHQTNWDWRAASNFMVGGAGGGLLVAVGVLAPAEALQRWSTAAALALVALGLFCVWLEIGRPLRSFNVLLHAGSSWMTRESMAAPLLFGCGALAIWRGGAWAFAAAFAGAAFLYCQARILKASRGIPAWRTGAIVPLIVVTGVAEGAGLLLAAGALLGRFESAPPILLCALVLARGVAWRSYRSALSEQGAPEQAFDALDACADWVVVIGQWVPLTLALTVLALDAHSMVGQFAALCAGTCAVCGGWVMKFTIVARAAFNQGFALPSLPVRGQRAVSAPSMRNAKPGWRAADD